MNLWGRTWALEWGVPGARGTRYSDLRIQFRASLSARGPSTCDIAVNNPPDELVRALHQRDNLYRVLAGYEGGPVEVAQGSLVPYSLRDRRSAEEPEVSWQTTAGAHHLQAASVSRSWSGPVTAREVIEEIRRTMGVPADTIEVGRPVSYARGYVLAGPPRGALASVCADTASEWSLSSGRLRVWPRGRSAARMADLWDASSGLLEAMAPQQDGTVRATALLRPALRPGDLVSIRDRVWSGLVAVVEVEHSGDTSGEVWSTSIAGVRSA